MGLCTLDFEKLPSSIPKQPYFTEFGSLEEIWPTVKSEKNCFKIELEALESSREVFG